MTPRGDLRRAERSNGMTSLILLASAARNESNSTVRDEGPLPPCSGPKPVPKSPPGSTPTTCSTREVREGWFELPKSIEQLSCRVLTHWTGHALGRVAP